MKPFSMRRWMGSISVTGVLLLAACSGESTSSGDDGSGGTSGTSTGGKAGSTGTGGSGGTTEPPDGVCEDIVPCGGDPEGSWTVRENCAELLVPIEQFESVPGCEDAVGRGSADIEGTFTFAGGVVTQDITVTAAVSLVVTDACAQGLLDLPDITAADVCPLLDAMLMMSATTPADCVVTSEGCQCDGTQPPTQNMSSDTYEIAGDQLIIGSSGEAFDFCQQGDELHMHGNIVEEQTMTVVPVTLLLDRL